VQTRPNIASQQQLCRIHEMMTQHKFYKKKKKKKKKKKLTGISCALLLCRNTQDAMMMKIL
jgi:hypothetical protein